MHALLGIALRVATAMSTLELAKTRSHSFRPGLRLEPAVEAVSYRVSEGTAAKCLDFCEASRRTYRRESSG